MHGIPRRRRGGLGVHVPLLHRRIGLLARLPTGLPIGLTAGAAAPTAGLAA